MNKSSRNHPSLPKQRGITLLELVVAMGILAWIMIIAQVVIQTAGRAGEISQTRSQELKDLDRVWILLEADLRNVVAHNYQPANGVGEALPAMYIAQSDEYILSFIRAGQANPLLLPRSEVLRVGYRVEDDILWRDSWIDPFNPTEEFARPQQLIEDVEAFEVLALPTAPEGRSVSDGPWLDQWPAGVQNEESSVLPLVLEIKLLLKNASDPEEPRELRRVFNLAPGV